MTNRPCTCHPDDSPPFPCPRKYALSECRAAAPPAVQQQAEPVAEGDTIQSEELPPVGHPLRTLGERLTHWLDDDQWNNAEPLLLEAYSLCSKNAPQQSAEPVAWARQIADFEPIVTNRSLLIVGSHNVPVPLYAAPPADDEAVRLLRWVREKIVSGERVIDAIDAYLAKVGDNVGVQPRRQASAGTTG